MTSSRRRIVFASIATVGLSTGVGAYIWFAHVDSTPEDTAAVERLMRGVQASHINANVPADADIERFLRRDLAEYFAVKRGKEASIDFKWLRRGPTQSGVSFPKFYLWVRIEGGESQDDRGAVRVAATRRNHFSVTDFVSERDIRGDPHAIYGVFPGPVCDRIHEELVSK